MILVRDRESLCRVGPDEAMRVPESGLPAALMDLLDPSWLISYFDLELAGAAEAAGRPAYRVTAAPRQVRASSSGDRYERFDRVDVLVDAELGILLRREAFSGGQSIEVTEVRSIALDPAEAGDPGQFRPPPGLPRTDPYAAADTIFGTSGPGWRVVKTGAKAAAVALAYRIRHASRDQPAPAGTSPPVPAVSALSGAYGRRVDAFAWGVVGSVAGVAGLPRGGGHGTDAGLAVTVLKCLHDG
jgi:hypothetical protein